MTAFTTVPFLVWPSGAASLTAAVIMSPRPAFNPVEPPSGRIICSLRAPELSATSSIDLIITAIAISPLCPRPSARVRLLHRDFDGGFRHDGSLAHNVFQLPALQLRERPRFFEADHIAHMRLIGFVVGVELFVARDHASVERMRLLARHLHHDGLVHAAGDDFSHDYLAPALHVFGLACGFSHYRFSVTVAPAVTVAVERPRSPRTVLTRAMSLRRPRIFFRLSVWPIFS